MPWLIVHAVNRLRAWLGQRAVFTRDKRVDWWLSNYPFSLLRDVHSLNTILDKINGTSGPPLPPIQWCQNGAFLLLRAFIIALGGKGVNCSFLFCPRLSEIHTGVTRCVIYGIGGNIVAVACFKVSLSITTQILRWKHTQTRLKKWFYDT